MAELRTGRENEETAAAAQLKRSGAARRADMLFLGLAAIVALAPLPLGSDRPLAWEAMGLITALLLIASVTAFAESSAPLIGDLTVPAVLFGLAIGFAGLQITPLTPAAWHNPLWDQAAETLLQRGPAAIAVDRQAALSHLLRLLTYAAILYLSVVLCRDPLRARAATKLVMLSGTFYAAYGLAVYWSGSKSILWYAKWAYVDDVTGPFVNRNSFATYLGLCLLATIAYLTLSLKDVALWGSWRRRLESAVETMSTRSWQVVCLFLIFTALCLTHSRGGFLSTLAGVIAIAFALSRARGLRASGRRAFAALPVVLIVLAFFVSGGVLVDRLADTSSETAGRFDVFMLTVQAIGDYPLQGIGLGSFQSVFPLYRTDAIQAFYDLAHDDYLQNALELGIPAAICFYAALLWLVGLSLRGIMQRRRDAAYPCLGAAASLLVGLHATVDFSLQIPAVTATYLFILGAGIAQSRSTR